MNDRIIDNGDMRKYRTEIPNSIDDARLSVYAFRLYAHLKRVAGDSGKCWQSTATLAESCSMSGGMVSKAKKELQAARLIEIEQVENKRGGRMFHNITVCDIWMENFIKYSTTSQHELASSPHEQASSPGELKKELKFKNKPYEELFLHFCKVTKLEPDTDKPRATEKYHTTLASWVSKGVTPDMITTAMQRAKNGRKKYTISGPWSLDNFISNLLMEREQSHAALEGYTAG